MSGFPPISMPVGNDPEEGRRWYRALVDARGGPLTTEHRASLAPSEWAHHEYVQWWMHDRDEEARTAASKLIGRYFDPTDPSCIRDYNATRPIYPLLPGSQIPLLSLVYSNEMHGAREFAEAYRKRVARDDQAGNEAIKFREAYQRAFAAGGAREAVRAAAQFIIDLKASTPEVSAALAWKAMAFLHRCQCPERVVVSIGSLAGIDEAVAANWVRTKLSN